MPDTQLLDTEQRKNKIRELTAQLSDRFNSVLKSTNKMSALRRLKPDVLVKYNDSWDELDKRFSEYLAGEIEWEGDSFQMEMTAHGFPYPRLVVDRDVQNFARDFFAWFILQTQKL